MYVVIDIGGTKMRIARSSDLESFEEPVIADSIDSESELIEYVCNQVLQLSEGEPVAGVVVGKPIWKANQDFSRELQKRVGAPVYEENDTALVGLGEAHYGAGKGTHIFAYLTISTGVNGVRIVDGSIDPSAQGFEIGGQYLQTSDATSWEEMISGAAIERRFGVHPRDLGKEHPVWEELARVAAYGVHNTVLHWSPEKVAIGGSMMNEIGIPVERIEYHVRHLMRKFPRVPEIVHSELKDVGGLWGGLAYLKALRS